MTEQKDTKNNNMELWNKVCETNKKYIKEVNNGSRTFFSIDSYYQLEVATKLWGSFGFKWGVKDETFTIIPDGKTALYTANLFYPADDEKAGYIPIHSDIKVYFNKGNFNSDWTKKAATDALTKGLSKLGFNHDVFMGVFDDKYHDPIDNGYLNNKKKEEPDNTDYKKIIKQYKEKASKPVKEKIEDFLGGNPDQKLMKSYINGFLSKNIKL